jgi:hypothetical protein
MKMMLEKLAAHPRLVMFGISLAISLLIGTTVDPYQAFAQRIHDPIVHGLKIHNP